MMNEIIMKILIKIIIANSNRMDISMACFSIVICGRTVWLPILLNIKYLSVDKNEYVTERIRMQKHCTIGIMTY